MKKLFVLLLTMILAAGVAFAQEGEAAPAQTETPAQAQAQASAQTQDQTQTPQAESAPAAPTRQIERMSLEVTIGFPVHWSHGTHDVQFYPSHPGVDDTDLIPMEDRFATANTAIGIALTFNFNRYVGFVLDADFFYGVKLHGFSNPASDYISLSSANIFLGPVFYLYNNNTFRVPLMVGLHMFYFADDVWVPELGGVTGSNSLIAGHWMNREELQFGLGLALGFQYHFNRNIYIFSRTNVSIDFVRMHSIKEVVDRNASGLDSTDYREASHIDLFTSIHWTVKPTIGIGVKLN